jgi:predicted MFS family arabinose efflux permease
LRETPVFEALRKRRVADARLPISLVFTRCKSEVLVSMAATWVFAGVFVTYFLYLPTYLQSQFDYRAADVFTANCWSITLLILGSVFVGRVTDIIGGGKAYAIGGAAMAAVVAALGISLRDGGAWSLHLYAIGGFVIGTITLTPYLIIRSFPPELRFTGFALSYNTAYAVVGGTTPPLMALLVGERALPTAPFYYMTALCLLGAAIGLLKGRKVRQ